MQLDRILRTILFTGIFFIPFIPFIVANSMFFPFITGKNFIFRILIEILFAAWFILALRNSSYRPTFSWILGALVLFVSAITVSDIFGANPLKSFWSNFERMEGLVTLIHLLLYFVVVGTTLNTEKLWDRFWNTSIGASAFMGIFGLLQLSGAFIIHQGGIRLDGRFGNATYFAIYMVFHLFLTCMMLVKWRGTSFVRYVYAFAMFLQFIILYYTATRGAILGFMGGAVLSALLALWFMKESKSARKISVGILIGAMVLVSGFFLIKDSDFVRDNQVLSRFANITIEGDLGVRMMNWRMAYEGFKERPILGWGQESYNLVFNKYYDPGMYAQEPWFDRVHNIIFDWLIAGGIIGLLAYIFIPLSVLYVIWFRSFDTFTLLDKSLLTGLLAAYGFHNLFVFDNLMSYILFISVIAYVYARTRPKVDESSSWGKQFSVGTTDRVVAPIVIIVLVLSVYSMNVKGISASKTLIKALTPHPEGIEANLEIFRDVVKQETLGGQEIREQLVQAATNAAARQDVEAAVRQEYFDLARAEMEKQIEHSPNDARLELFLASLYDTYGFPEEAAAHFERAHELSPKKQTIRFALALSYLNRGLNTEAVALMKETVELDPSFDAPQTMYATVAIYAGERELSDQILLDHFGTTTIDNNRLMKAYLDSGQYGRARNILESRLLTNPTNRDTHLMIAGTYLREGNSSAGINTIENYIVIEPSFSEEGKQLIESIRNGTAL